MAKDKNKGKKRELTPEEQKKRDDTRELATKIAKLIVGGGAIVAILWVLPFGAELLIKVSGILVLLGAIGLVATGVVDKDTVINWWNGIFDKRIVPMVEKRLVAMREAQEKREQDISTYG